MKTETFDLLWYMIDEKAQGSINSRKGYKALSAVKTTFTFIFI